MDEPKVKTPQTPADEFAQLASELKNIVSTQGREASEAKASLEKINDRMDDLEFKFETNKVANPDPNQRNEHDDAFEKAFVSFAKGEREGLKQMEVKSGYHPHVKSDNIVRFDFVAAGALLVPNQRSTEILRNAIESTPAMSLVRTVMTNAPEYEQNIRKGTPGGTWLGEEEEVDKKKPEFRRVKITPHMWASRYAWTAVMEQDGAQDLNSELMLSFREDFEVDIGSAIVSGNGAGKPTGIIGNVSNMNSGALELEAKHLVQLQESLLEVYQNRGSWLMNRKTRGNVRTFLLANESTQYLWEPDFQRRSPTLLLGNPVYIAREGDLAGKFEGDYTLNDVPIIFGDFNSGYMAAVRTDMYIIDDPYSESSRFVRNLNIMTRIGGHPTKEEALITLTMTN